MNNVRPIDIYNYLYIDEQLTTSGQPTVDELQALAQESVEVVINLALHDDPRYSLPDEAASVSSLRMIYVHIPVKFDAPTEADLHKFFAAMALHAGKKMHLHCAANKRVTAFLGLYRVLARQWIIERAFAPMREVWEPQCRVGAFHRRNVETPTLNAL